jgi:hypothetical protein
MRANVLRMCGFLALMGCLGLGCPDGNGPVTPGVDGGTPDGGSRPDGGDAGQADAGTDAGWDGGMGVTACDVAQQRGCASGELCLRASLEDGGQENRCFAGGCDPVLQDCATGEKCTYVRDGDTARRQCVKAGTGSEGERCFSTTTDGGMTDTCQVGLYCTDRSLEDGGTSFTCQRFCHGSDQCTAPSECSDVLRFAGSEELPRVCGEPGVACDLLTQNCTDPAMGCYPSPRGSASVCVVAGMVEDGVTCTYSNDCRAGSACVRSGTGQVCRRLCRHPSGEPSCATGRCEPLQGFADAGACVP